MVNALADCRKIPYNAGMSTQPALPHPVMMQRLLTGEVEFRHPHKILESISAEDACRRLAGLPYSIAGLLGHLQWWQARRLHLARGGEWEPFELQVDDWPAVGPEAWESLRADFLATLEQMAELTADSTRMAEIIFEDRTVGEMLVSHATHNAYHLGQIVLMRRMLGSWSDEGSQ